MHQRIGVAGVAVLMVSTLSALAPVPAGAQPESDHNSTLALDGDTGGIV